MRQFQKVEFLWSTFEIFSERIQVAEVCEGFIIFNSKENSTKEPHGSVNKHNQVKEEVSRDFRGCTSVYKGE